MDIETNKRTVCLGQELFEFFSEQDWINKAKSRFGRINNVGITREKYICLDNRGRVCTKGMEFMRATKDNSYPVKVYLVVPC